MSHVNCNKPFEECLNLKDNCIGCNNCIEICPVNALSYGSDRLGFLIPIADGDKCISCGKCVKACPILQYSTTPKGTHNLMFGVGWNISEEILQNSSSGGFFSAAAKQIISEGGMVCGAIYDEEFKSVKHILTDNSMEIVKMRGSKYVQSRKHDVFFEIKKVLPNRKVLFTGTPCEVGALKQILGEDSPNLISCDFICYGPTSPKLFGEFSDFITEKFGKLVDFTMRSKKLGWTRDYLLGMKFESGRKFIKFLGDTPLGTAFTTFRRPSCFNCLFKGDFRRSDITMGDYWRALSSGNTFNYNEKGTSQVIVNTEKGMHFIKSLSADFYFEQKNLSDLLHCNPTLYKSAPLPPEYNKKTDRIAKIGLLKFDSENRGLKGKIKLLIPAEIQYALRKCRHHIAEIYHSIFRRK